MIQERRTGIEHRIRRMIASDLDEVLHIEEQSFQKPWTRSMFESELRNQVSTAYAALVNDGKAERVAAYMVFWIVYGEAHILNVAVHPDWRRMGLARALLEQSLTFMKRNLVYEVFLEVRRSNEAARRLYRDMDFKETFERKNYYGDEDAIVMVRSL